MNKLISQMHNINKTGVSFIQNNLKLSSITYSDFEISCFVIKVKLVVGFSAIKLKDIST